MNRNALIENAKRYRIPFRWRTSNSIRIDLMRVLDPPRRATDAISGYGLVGIKRLTRYEEIGVLRITVRHKWWALPFIRKNMKVIKKLGELHTAAGVDVDIRSEWIF